MPRRHANRVEVLATATITLFVRFFEKVTEILPTPLRVSWMA